MGNKLFSIRFFHLLYQKFCPLEGFVIFLTGLFFRLVGGTAWQLLPNLIFRFCGGLFEVRFQLIILWREKQNKYAWNKCAWNKSVKRTTEFSPWMMSVEWIRKKVKQMNMVLLKENHRKSVSRNWPKRTTKTIEDNKRAFKTIKGHTRP